MRLLRQFVVLLLLAAIPLLSTLAKKDWYLPQASTAHYLNGAVKMKATHAAVASDLAPCLPAFKLTSPAARTEKLLTAEPDISAPEIGIVISLLHRSPPITPL